MERKSSKEYSEAAIMGKEELQAMKSCFEGLNKFISMRGDISSVFRSQNRKSAIDQRMKLL